MLQEAGSHLKSTLCLGGSQSLVEWPPYKGAHTYLT